MWQKIFTRLFIPTLLLLSPYLLKAQQYGSIAGKVTDAASGALLTGATLMVSGTSLGAASDVDGGYLILNVPYGSHQVVCKYLGYETTILKNVVVNSRSAAPVDIRLKRAGSRSLNELVVVSSYRKASVQALYTSQRKAAGILDGMVADQIRSSPDKHVADVLQRVTGTSIEDNKFVVVRGLCERYNVTEMNAAVMPSTEPDKNAFSFDIIPSDLVASVVIHKTVTPDLPGDAAGGVVQVDTKDFPDHRFVSLSLSSGFNTVSTGRHFYQGRSGSKLDLLGFDDGSRRLPATFESVRSQYPAMSTTDKAAVTSQFANTFGAKAAGSALPPLGIQFSLGNSKVFGNGSKLGYIGAFTYGISRGILRGDRSDFLISREQLYDFSDVRYTSASSSGALFNLSYAFGDNKITWKNFFSNEFNSTFVVRSGQQFDGAANSQQVFSQNDEATGNGLFNTVLGGKHLFGSTALRMNWNLSYGRSYRNQPDQRILTLYQKKAGDPYELRLSNENSPAIKDAGRVYSNLHENIVSANVDFSLPFKLGGRDQTFRFGGLAKRRVRHFDALALGYASYLDPLGRGATIAMTNGLSPENLFSPEHLDEYKIILANIAQNSKDYQGTANLEAGYLMADGQLGARWRAVWGVRLEQHTQQLSALNQPVQTYRHFDILPSLNLTWMATDRTNLRFAYSKTVNRPEFRELASFRYYDYEDNFIISGNPNLTRSLNDNGDIRLSCYPSEGEVLSASFFYKYFRHPIEQTNEGNGVLAYRNADNATDYGMELELRKKLDFSAAPVWLRHLVVFANASVIRGSVRFDGTSSGSPLQGQSPYLLNGGLSYGGAQDGYSVSLRYNRIGDRLKYRGEQEGLDTYEKSRDVLDFQIGKSILHRAAEIRLTMSDILSEPLVLYYKYPGDKNTPGGIQTISSFRQGSAVSISFKYNFGSQK